MVGGWTKGRVVLIGDAAHAMTPHLASGGVMAPEDAIVLAKELASRESHFDACEMFNARRFQRAKYSFDTSVALCQMEGNPGKDAPNAHRIRGDALKRLAALITRGLRTEARLT